MIRTAWTFAPSSMAPAPGPVWAEGPGRTGFRQPVRPGRAAIDALARGDDPAACGHLLRLTRAAGEAVGDAARTMADHTSWTGVAEIAGTSRQAAWERWRGR
jgi:hypothetical protein